MRQCGNLQICKIKRVTVKQDNNKIKLSTLANLPIGTLKNVVSLI